MKPYRLNILQYISYLFLVGVAFSGNAFSQSSPAKSSNLERVSISEVGNWLRTKAMMRINFIEAEYSRNEAETVGGRLKEIGEIPLEQRTPFEHGTFKLLSGMLRSEGDANLIIGPKYNRGTLNLNDAISTETSNFQIIKAVQEAFKGYECSSSNGSFIFEPKTDQKKSGTIVFRLNKVSIDDAFSALSKNVLEPLHIRLVDIGFLDSLSGKKELITLNIEGVSLPVCLTRFAEAIGPDIVWTIRGQKGFRAIQFSRLPSENE